jgi:hypothetical protein
LLCQEQAESTLSPETLALAALRGAIKVAKQGGPPRLKLLAAPVLIEVLKRNLSEALAETETKLGIALILTGEPNRQLPNWEIIAA